MSSVNANLMEIRSLNDTHLTLLKDYYGASIAFVNEINGSEDWNTIINSTKTLATTITQMATFHYSLEYTKRLISMIPIPSFSWLSNIPVIPYLMHINLASFFQGTLSVIKEYSPFISSILITQLVAAKILPSIFKSYQKSDIGKSLDNIVYLPQVRDFFRVKLINTSIEQLAGSFDFMLLDYFAKEHPLGKTLQMEPILTQEQANLIKTLIVQYHTTNKRIQMGKPGSLDNLNTLKHEWTKCKARLLKSWNMRIVTSR